jgi:hypothetical protein
MMMRRAVAGVLTLAGALLLVLLAVAGGDLRVAPLGLLGLLLLAVGLRLLSSSWLSRSGYAPTLPATTPGSCPTPYGDGSGGGGGQ